MFVGQAGVCFHVDGSLIRHVFVLLNRVGFCLQLEPKAEL